MLTPLPGLKSLWERTRGDPRVTIAILDGPVDLSHPCFNGALLTILPTLVAGEANSGFATQHGTHVASVIWGQPESSVPGIAPRCRGLIVPVFTDGPENKLAPCSQIDLARAITQAVAAGANVINISGGQLTASGESDRLLMNAIRYCQENHVLIVAAAGNEGCECLHIPAALESVLAVGAMDAQGRPLEFSNWGKTYQSQGILAPGENLLGAQPGGGTVWRSGTNFATPIVSGIVALLLSIQLQRGQLPDPDAIREALLHHALSCQLSEGLEPQRCLMGRLNLSGIDVLLKKGGIQAMSMQEPEEAVVQPSAADSFTHPVRVRTIPSWCMTSRLYNLSVSLFKRGGLVATCLVALSPQVVIAQPPQGSTKIATYCQSSNGCSPSIASFVVSTNGGNTEMTIYGVYHANEHGQQQNSQFPFGLGTPCDGQKPPPNVWKDVNTFSTDPTGVGLGTVLLYQSARMAKQNGIDWFYFSMMSPNMTKLVTIAGGTLISEAQSQTLFGCKASGTIMNVAEGIPKLADAVISKGWYPQ